MIARGDDLDPCSDRRPIGLLSQKFQTQPMVPLTRVFEKDVVVSIALARTPHLDEEINVAVPIKVSAGDTMPLLKVAGARGRSDLSEPSAFDILEHAIRNQRFEIRRARPKVEVKK